MRPINGREMVKVGSNPATQARTEEQIIKANRQQQLWR
jgi:hypothetical protein